MQLKFNICIQSFPRYYFMSDVDQIVLQTMQERKTGKLTHCMLNTYTLRKDKKYWFLFQGQWCAWLHSNRASYERKKLVPAVIIVKFCLDKLPHNESKLVCLVLYPSYPQISKYYLLYASAPASYIVFLFKTKEKLSPVDLHSDTINLTSCSLDMRFQGQGSLLLSTIPTSCHWLLNPQFQSSS